MWGRGQFVVLKDECGKGSKGLQLQLKSKAYGGDETEHGPCLIANSSSVGVATNITRRGLVERGGV